MENLEKRFNRRLFLIAFSIAIIFVLLGAYLVYFVNANYENYNDIVLSKKSGYNTRISISGKRGDIKDRNGIILATSIKTYNLIIDPSVINSYDDGRFLEPTIDALKDVYGYDKEELRKVIEEKKDKAYLRYKKGLSEEERDAFNNYKNDKNDEYRKTGLKNRINGIWFELEYKRYYPQDTVASNIIGFLNNDGNPVMGVEKYYDTDLSGETGRQYSYLDGDNNLRNVYIEASAGNDLILSIDYDIQSVAEQAINNFYKFDVGAKTVNVLIMDPRDGSVLAMAESNNFNLNAPRDRDFYVEKYGEEYVDEVGLENIWFSTWKNNIVQDTFEPGSTAKVFTSAMGLEEATVDLETVFECKGSITLEDGENKWTIRCINRKGHGEINLVEAIADSCNLAMAQIAEMIGPKKFAIYQRNFGFGEMTNIDLPSEADTKDLVYNENNMGRTDLSTNSFGQNFNVTMIQLASAFSSIVNGGFLYEPKVVDEIINNKGSVSNDIKKNLRKLTISKDTCDFLKASLLYTVTNGTGRLAQVRGKNIGGKTGTAEKLPRSDKNYLVSFIGFDNVDNPKYVVYVVVDTPNLEGEAQANSSFAVKIFKEIMESLN